MLAISDALHSLVWGQAPSVVCYPTGRFLPPGQLLQLRFQPRLFCSVGACHVWFSESPGNHIGTHS